GLCDQGGGGAAGAPSTTGTSTQAGNPTSSGGGDGGGSGSTSTGGGGGGDGGSTSSGPLPGCAPEDLEGDEELGDACGTFVDLRSTGAGLNGSKEKPYGSLETALAQTPEGGSI